MTSPLRRVLLGALALAATALPVTVALPSPAYAAEVCASLGETGDTIADSAAAVPVVFAGEVRSTTQESRAEPFVYVVDVTHVWKDEEVVARTVRVKSPSAKTSDCSLGDLAPGTPMVFFAQSRGDVFWTNQRLGSAEDEETLREEIAAVLGPGLTRGPDGREENVATMTRVETDPPPTLSRLAAPGLAVALVGVLGLFLIAFTNRRRVTPS